MREHWAFLAAVTINGFSGLVASLSSKRRKPKTIKPDDFIDKDFLKLFMELFPEEEKKKKKGKPLELLVEDAKAKGLSGPWSKVGETE